MFLNSGRNRAIKGTKPKACLIVVGDKTLPAFRHHPGPSFSRTSPHPLNGVVTSSIPTSVSLTGGPPGPPPRSAKLARSAPVVPGVRRGARSRSTSLARALPRA